MEGTTAKIFSDCLEYWQFDQKLMVKTLTGEYQEAGNLLKQRNYSSQTFFIPKDLLTSRRMFNSYTRFEALKLLQSCINKKPNILSRIFSNMGYKKNAQQLMTRLWTMPHCPVEINSLIRDIDKLILLYHQMGEVRYKGILEEIKEFEMFELKNRTSVSS